MKKLIICSLCLYFASCLRPAEERATWDREVGIGQTEDVSVQIVDGLAAIHQLDQNQMVLWSSAPTWDLDLEMQSDPDEDFTILVKNCLPNSALHVVFDDGQELEILGQQGTRPTVRSFEIPVSSGQSVYAQLTPPDADDASDFRFAVLGDMHGVSMLSALFSSLNADRSLRFVVSIGDLTGAGEQSEIESLQNRLTNLNIPFYTTVGNRETDGDSTRTWHELFGRFNFHFEYRGVHFTLVDSAAATIDPIVYDELNRWLDDGKDSMHFFFSHIAPLDPRGWRSGSFRSRSEAGKLLALLASGNVDAAFHGHVHEYFKDSFAGIPTIIVNAETSYLTVEVKKDTQTIEVEEQK